MNSSSNSKVDTAKEGLYEILIWIVGGAATLTCAFLIRENLIYTGVCFAVTLNSLFFLNRRLPTRPTSEEVVDERSLQSHMKECSLASIRRQYRFLAFVGDAALLYLVIDHFVL